ncbi:hypothetical protein [Paenibacillus alvei]|uniref:hypothetical protein n=1 Tax=Paenibacillus alvei TaxID=44250 RepID=UPI0010FE4BF5|nr:hypothetical protein [Paenibacillus alvei]
MNDTSAFVSKSNQGREDSSKAGIACSRSASKLVKVKKSIFDDEGCSGSSHDEYSGRKWRKAGSLKAIGGCDQKEMAIIWRQSYW